MLTTDYYDCKLEKKFLQLLLYLIVKKKNSLKEKQLFSRHGGSDGILFTFPLEHNFLWRSLRGCNCEIEYQDTELL